MNKNGIFNIVLAVAVAVLFVLHFSAPKGNVSETTDTTSASEEDTLAMVTLSDTFSVDALKGSSFLIVDMDYVNENYEYILKKKNTLEGKQRKLLDKQQKAQEEISALEANILRKQQSGLYLSQQEMERDYQKFQEKAYELQNKLAAEEQKLLEATNSIQIDLKNKMTDFFKRYGDEMEADMIIYSGEASNVIYNNDKLDISKDVVDRLNAEYKAKK